MKIWKEYVLNFINGFCMALADSVPGVSGGTVAFILGFYEKFIVSLDNLFRGDWNQKKLALKYLFKVGIGWIVGLLLAISFLASLFEKNIYAMSSLFIGFIIFAIPVVIKEEKINITANYFNYIYMLLGAALVVLITYLNRVSLINVNLDTFNIGTALYVFLVGAVAISAMILPGISGSTILLIFGVYLPIVAKVKSIIELNFSSLPIIVFFGLGVLFGIVFFTKLLRKLLEKKRTIMVWIIIGMMIASIYSIIMGPTTLDTANDILTFKTFNIWFFLLGGLIILSLEGIKELLSKKTD